MNLFSLKALTDKWKFCLFSETETKQRTSDFETPSLTEGVRGVDLSPQLYCNI